MVCLSRQETNRGILYLYLLLVSNAGTLVCLIEVVSVSPSTGLLEDYAHPPGNAVVAKVLPNSLVYAS